MKRLIAILCIMFMSNGAQAFDYPALTNNFVARQLISASKIMQNYNDVLSGMTTGTYKINVAELYTNGVLVVGNNQEITSPTASITVLNTTTGNITNIGAYTLTGKLTAGSSEIEGSNFDITGGTATLNALYVDDDISSVTSENSAVNTITVKNTGTNGASARFLAVTDATFNDSDPYFQVGNTTLGDSWSIGMDVSDDDELVISNTGGLSGKKFAFDRAGTMSIGKDDAGTNNALVLYQDEDTTLQMINSSTGSGYQDGWRFLSRDHKMVITSGGNPSTLIISALGTELVVTANQQIYTSSSFGIGTSSKPTLNDNRILYLGDNTNDPDMNVNTAGLYAKDVAGTVELFAIDEADNSTQLSSHDPLTGEWIFYSKNTRTGRIVEVDMEKFFRHYDAVNGTSFYSESMPLEGP